MLVIGVFKLLFVSYLIDFTCLRLISACLLELVGLGLYTWFVYLCLFALWFVLDTYINCGVLVCFVGLLGLINCFLWV